MNALQAPPLQTVSSIFSDYCWGASPMVSILDPLFSPFTVPATIPNGLPTIESAPAPAKPPVIELAAISLNKHSCPLCIGKRYDFAAYLHNPRLFYTPPHELLRLVEWSYVLKSRLQSILVTYVTRDLEVHGPDDGELDINTWLLQVNALAREVSEMVLGADEVERALEEARIWAQGLAEQLLEHLRTSMRKRMIVPKGWMKERGYGFRKRWETVWLACAQLHGNVATAPYEGGEDSIGVMIEIPSTDQPCGMYQSGSDAECT